MGAIYTVIIKNQPPLSLEPPLSENLNSCAEIPLAGNKIKGRRSTQETKSLNPSVWWTGGNRGNNDRGEDRTSDLWHMSATAGPPNQTFM